MIQDNNFSKDNVKSDYPISLSFGYCVTEVTSRNTLGEFGYSILCGRFPSYARKIEKVLLELIGPTSNQILYEDCTTGQAWIVGEIAQEIAKENGELIGTEACPQIWLRSDGTEICPQVWLRSDKFLVLARVGIALGFALIQGEIEKIPKIQVCKGLGINQFDHDDHEFLRNVLTQKHHFRVKFAEEEWKEYLFTIDKENLFVE